MVPHTENLLCGFRRRTCCEDAKREVDLMAVKRELDLVAVKRELDLAAVKRDAAQTSPTSAETSPSFRGCRKMVSNCAAIADPNRSMISYSPLDISQRANLIGKSD